MPSSFYQSRRDPFAPQQGTGNDQYTNQSPPAFRPAAAWQQAGNAGWQPQQPAMAQGGQAGYDPIATALAFARNPMVPQYPVPQFTPPQMPAFAPSWQPPQLPSPGAQSQTPSLAAELQALLSMVRPTQGGLGSISTGMARPQAPGMPQAQEQPAPQGMTGPGRQAWNQNYGPALSPAMSETTGNYWQGLAGLGAGFDQAQANAGLGWGGHGSAMQRQQAELPIMREANLLAFLANLYRPMIS